MKHKRFIVSRGNFHFSRIVWPLLSLALFVSSILLWDALRDKREQHSELKKTHASLAVRASALTETALHNSRLLDAALAEVPYCDPDHEAISNASFDPPLPYFVEQDATQQRELRLQTSGAASAVDIAMLLPVAGLDRYALQFENRQKSFRVAFDYELLGDEISAYDFVAIGSKSGKLCKFDARLHLARAPEANQPSPLRIFGRIGLGWGRFSLPYGTDIDDAQHTIVVSDCTNHLVQEFSYRGDLIRIFGGDNDVPPDLRRPSDVKIHDGKVYVVEEDGNAYRIFDRTGKYLSTHGSLLKRLGKDLPPERLGDQPTFSNPLGIALDRHNSLYVVDYGNHRLLKLDADGRVLKVVSEKELFDGKPFNGPYYIDINDELGRIYVDDRGNDRIVVLDLDLTYLFSFGHRGTGPGEFHFPHELDIAPDGRVFIADTYNKRIQIFDADGKYLDQIVTGPALGLPKTVAVTREGLVFTGHLGRDAYMAVWHDPMEKRPAKSIDDLISQTPKAEKSQLAVKKAMVDSNLDQTVFKRICSSCHATGALGAPRAKIPEDWERFPRNISALLELARQGKGAMMPSGGCTDCSDEELKEAIRFMLPDTWKGGVAE